MITLEEVEKIFWVSMKNKLYNVSQFWYVYILFFYGPGYTVRPSFWLKDCCTNIKQLVISMLFSVLVVLLHVNGSTGFLLEMGSKIFQHER
jgi:hypothetical protein